MSTQHADPPSALPLPAVVVEPNEPDMHFISEVLTSARFTVRATDTFQSAKALLVTQPPLILVAEIRLGAFNGLQLALRAASTNPRIPVIITSRVHDPVLQRDAESIGATFVLKPLTREELLAAAYRTALRRPGPSGASEPIQPPFERRHEERRRGPALNLELERRQADRRRDAHLVLYASAALA